MPEEFDLANLDPSDPEAIKQLRAAYERQANKAAEAEKGLAEARAAQRQSELTSIFTNLKAPGKLADLYPSDAEVNEDAVKTFLRDKVGLTPDVNEAWNRYEQLGNRSEPPAPAQDEDALWAQKALAATKDFYSRTNAPTAEEISAMTELKNQVFNKLDQWDQDVVTGKRGPLIESGGFGGLTDPPAYAVRARHYMSSATS